MSTLSGYGPSSEFGGPVEAVYHKQEIKSFAGNPFIEALPPIMTKNSAIKEMQRSIDVNEKERQAPVEVRLHMLGEIERFVQPLSVHVELYNSISKLIRWGYVERNPIRKDFLEKLLSTSTEIPPPDVSSARGHDSGRSKTTGLTLLGQSGVGKTTAIKAVLGTFPQVIRHTRLEGALRSVHQLTWISIPIPSNGSLKDLCVSFFRSVDDKLGTNYLQMHATRGATAGGLRGPMAKVAFAHGLGVLVIDELQNLNEAKSGVDKATMMNFLQLLRDDMSIPVITVGTMQAYRLVAGNSQMARRHAGFPIFERMSHGGEFEFFCSSLFEVQYLTSRVELDDTNPQAEAWFKLLYDLSQGLTAVLVKLFIVAQDRAISGGYAALEMGIFTSVYESCFYVLHPYLERMRRGQPIDDGDLDFALRDSNLDSLIAASNRVPMPDMRTRRELESVPAVSEHPSQNDHDHLGEVTGVKKRRKPRMKGDVSPVALIAAMEEGFSREASSHKSLTLNGFIRNIGQEALEK
jgi:hypothetical protein